ncbi:MAG: hypothetical protein DSY91_06575 [Deltaproteobacteria bacterium]|nr:MAG: hypothetical protein DSY91_06575 [Deltaproteobacteria bacterium]
MGNRDVDAYGYVAKVGYRFSKVPMKPNLVIGRVFASGDRSPKSGLIRTFTRPFGSTDGEHYGRMDIMFWSNLIDNQVSLYLVPLLSKKRQLPSRTGQAAEEDYRTILPGGTFWSGWRRMGRPSTSTARIIPWLSTPRRVFGSRFIRSGTCLPMSSAGS